MESLLKYGQVGLTFMLVLTLLVGVHEYGHYIVARMFGMKVNAFAIMMGGVRDRNFAEGGKVPSATLTWVAGLILLVLALVGGLEKMPSLYQVGMVGLAFVMPVWISLRIGKIYQADLRESLKPLATGYMVFALVALFALRNEASLNSYLALAFFGGWMGVLFAYYKPVLGKAPEQRMGEGEVVTASGETIPVQFRPIWCRKDKNGTEFSLLALPLGGFCAIAGMNPDETPHEPNGFFTRPAWQRFLVLFAGPIFSLLLGVILLTGFVKANGLPNGTAFIENFRVESKADDAGMQIGDRVLSVNGRKVEAFEDMRKAIAATPKGQSAQMVVEREGKPIAIPVPTYTSKESEPEYNAEGLATGRKVFPAVVGVILRFGSRPAGWGESFTEACKLPGAMAAGLFSLAKQPTLVTNNVGGAASMVAATKKATDAGWLGVIRMAGLLSMSLGIMNLLPIQPLDGGQMMVSLYEMIRRKPMSQRALAVISGVGVLLIMLLMFTVLVADVTRFTGG